MPPPAGTAKKLGRIPRARFVEPTRIRAGAAFWRARTKRGSQRAEALYGVPPEIVVGIVGVETIYGQQMGNFRVIDALATLSFDFPTGRKDRSAFFRDELESFLVMCQIQDLEPLGPLGSFAGAMGMPQFMPSSFNQYAVDLDGDGRIDPARQRRRCDRQRRALPRDVRLAPRFADTLSMWRCRSTPPIAPRCLRQISCRASRLPSSPSAGAQLDSANLRRGCAAAGQRRRRQACARRACRTATRRRAMSPAPANFYAVTRYNWSSYYALAVIELGEAVAREVGRVRPVTVPICGSPHPLVPASSVPAAAPALAPVPADPSVQVESPDPEVP